MNAGRSDGIVIISQLADAITINESECNSRLSSCRRSTDFPVEIRRCARTCSLEIRVRRLSRPSKDYDVRILPTARGYCGRAQLLRNPDRQNDGDGDVVHDPRSAEATRPPHSRSSFCPVHELAVTFSSPYAEIIPRGSSPSLSLPPLFASALSDVLVRRRLVPAGTSLRLGRATAINHRRHSANAVSTFFSQFNSQEELFFNL